MKLFFKCKKCGMVYNEENLYRLEVDAKDENGNWITYHVCPNCATDEYLENAMEEEANELVEGF